MFFGSVNNLTEFGSVTVFAACGPILIGFTAEVHGDCLVEGMPGRIRPKVESICMARGCGRMDLRPN